ncbi:S1C family serine protease [Fontivita pretiosa]|uniref:S1C family serine protease n=1 Tax=Fontivita pretiosa TaxID=2989684 RepID=UPI003D17895E
MRYTSELAMAMVMILAMGAAVRPAQAQTAPVDPYRLAVERADEAKKRAVLSRSLALRSTRTEKAAFLGVVTSPVSAAMREQLKLPKGVGLVVESVEDDSPAERAGIKQYDILQKLDDQLLINSHQLAVLIRMHKPGDQVSITLLRQGQTQTITATLVEKELPSIDDAAGPWGIPGIDIFRELPGGRIDLRGGGKVDLDDIVKWTPKEMMTLSVSDPQHTLTLTIRHGKQHLTAIDKDGNVVFNGPVDTEQQREALPAEIKPKVEKLLREPQMIQLKLKRVERSQRSDEEDHEPATQP